MRVEKWAQVLLSLNRLSREQLSDAQVYFLFQERDEMFRRSLGQLKADIMRANGSVQEANFLAEEMEKQTKFSVTLQIPPANLSPNRRVSVPNIYRKANAV